MNPVLNQVTTNQKKTFLRNLKKTILRNPKKTVKNQNNLKNRIFPILIKINISDF